MFAAACADERVQFGAALGSFQLVQEKLARMLANLQAMFLMCWRLSKLYEEVSLGTPRTTVTISMQYHARCLAGKGVTKACAAATLGLINKVLKGCSKALALLIYQSKGNVEHCACVVTMYPLKKVQL